jgi:hypothetical protein
VDEAAGGDDQKQRADAPAGFDDILENDDEFDTPLVDVGDVAEPVDDDDIHAHSSAPVPAPAPAPARAAAAAPAAAAVPAAARAASAARAIAPRDLSASPILGAGAANLSTSPLADHPLTLSDAPHSPITTPTCERVALIGVAALRAL